MSDLFSKRLVYDTIYGEGAVVLDSDTISQFLYETGILSESTKAANINGISDEGLYDFFASFADYKRNISVHNISLFTHVSRHNAPPCLALR